MTSNFDLQKIRVSCADCSLAELCLPAGLDKDSLDKLEDTVKRSKPISKGDHIFRAGTELHSLYAIRTGSVKLVQYSPSGEEQIIGFYLPGEIIGLDAIENNQHQCNAIALETMSYCSFAFSQLENLGQMIPGLQHQMLRLMSKELRAENQLLLTVNNKKADARVATFLMNISERLHNLGYASDHFNLAMSRQDIANYLGLTIETISRIISRFQADAILQAERKDVKILDKDKLSQLCSHH